MTTLEGFVGLVGKENVQKVRDGIKTIVKPVIDTAPSERHGINGDYLLSRSLLEMTSRHPGLAESHNYFHGLCVEALKDVMREYGYTTPAPGTLPPRMESYLLEFYKENPES